MFGPPIAIVASDTTPKPATANAPTMTTRTTTARLAPRTGTKINAIASDAVNVAINVMGRNFMNSPTTPGQNNKGRKAAKVVAVDEIMGQAIRFAAMP